MTDVDPQALLDDEYRHWRDVAATYKAERDEARAAVKAYRDALTADLGAFHADNERLRAEVQEAIDFLLAGEPSDALSVFRAALSPQEAP